MNSYRFACCNEAFENRDFADVCRTLRTIGYDGIEIAPFTLAPDPLDVSPERRRELRTIMDGEGIVCVGLHWIMVTKEPLHVTTPDRALREKSWLYVDRLIDLCADLDPLCEGPKVMVFGSPKQRSSTGGMSSAEAVRNYVEGLAGIAPHAEARGVTILVEALPKSQSDVICTLSEAAAVVNEINSPGVRTMFDSHNSEDETEPVETVIGKHIGLMRHVHVNEMDGSHPGNRDYDFPRMFRALAANKYGGWVSVEAFNFEHGADNIARDALRYLRGASERG